MERILQFLHIRRSLPLAHVEARIMTENAGTNFLVSSFQNLCHPFRIRQKRTRKADAIKRSGSHFLCANIRIHASCGNDRNRHGLFYFLYLRQITIFRHVNRRMAPIPSVIRAVVAVEHVITSILQIARCPTRFVHISANFRVRFAGKGSLTESLRLGFHRIPQRDRKIFSTNALNLTNNVHRKTVPIFPTTTIGICAVIDVW